GWFPMLDAVGRLHVRLKPEKCRRNSVSSGQVSEREAARAISLSSRTISRCKSGEERQSSYDVGLPFTNASYTNCAVRDSSPARVNRKSQIVNPGALKV